MAPDGMEGSRLNFRMKSGYFLCQLLYIHWGFDFTGRLSLFFSWTVSVSGRGFVDTSLGLQVKSHSKGTNT